MQDKEFDRLFKDRFENAEVQPAADLWGNIAEQLEPRGKGGRSAYWWSAAAAVMVTLGIGLLSPKTEKIRLHSTAVLADAAVISKDTVPVPATGVLVSTAAEEQPGATLGTPLVIAPRYRVPDEKNNAAALQPNAADARPDMKKPETVTVENTLSKDKAPEANEVMIANADLPAENNTEAVTETAPQEHKGIRNVGDLVNFVVNKVDKRENKLVQFDTDDDNSSLVSLNLGIIRFSKKSNK